MDHPSMPPVGRIEQGIAPSLVCLVCDEPEPPEASEPPTP